MGRVVNLEDLIKEREAARASGKRLVFTNGCFDILHRGHVELLRAAKAMGDLLCVAVNSDRSVRKLKGARRPIVPEADRAAVLAALAAVDFVVIFDQDTPAEVISRVRPDVLVKGSDYAAGEIVGKEDVERDGGIVSRFPLVGGLSTETLLTEIARRYKDLVKPDS